MVSDVRQVVAITGPTASGKTALSVQLAQRLHGQIINADSVQLYRGMDIGSAKPTLSERAGIEHHLIDVLDVHEEANVSQFQRHARSAIDQVAAQDALPILVGGSSLYQRAVLDDLRFPGTDRQVRDRWEKQLRLRGSAELHAELARRDAHAAEQILPSNGRRIVRALEVIELTGQPFSATMPGYSSIYRNVVLIGLAIEREVLDQRITARVEQMWQAGFVDEVRRLSAAGLADSPTASRALGYQQILAMLRGDISENEAMEQTVAGTKKFARRQERMFTKDPRVHWVAYDQPDLVDHAVRLVERQW